MKKRRERTYSRTQIVDMLYNFSHHKVAYSNRPHDFKDIAELLQTTWWHRRRYDQKEFHQFVTDIARGNAYKIYRQATALSNAYRFAKHWIRAPKDWQPSVEIAEDECWETASNMLLCDLLKYLFGYYDVPVFMNEAWVKGNKQMIDWYLHLANGQNIRTAPELPVKLSKKMAHHFSETPPGYGIYQALYYGQVTALGGSLALYKALMRAKLERIARDTEFWRETIQFLINQPAFVENHQVEPLIDFINAQKYDRTIRYNQQGEIVANQVGFVPVFSLKGRTYQSLMRLIREWHDWLNDAQYFEDFLNEYGTDSVSWNSSEVGEFYFYPSKNSLQWYSIKEITNSKGLFAEGRQMHHCVASYLNSCMSGQCSIWSLSLEDLFRKTSKILTIEVINDKRVAQVRGVYNRMPASQEKRMIKEWASAEGMYYEGY